VDEAHVEHAVGLVEHEVGDVIEAYELLVQEIEQPPRRGDDELGQCLERDFLTALVDAAVDDRM
jgi:hypothetical protein